jgi:hypothetical protein
MKTKLEVFSAAKTLSTTTGREDLAKAVTEKQAIVAKLTKERDELTDSSARIVATAKVEAATDELMEVACAVELQDALCSQGEALFNRVAKTLSSAGITVRERTSTVSLIDQIRNSNKSFFSRLF